MKRLIGTILTLLIALGFSSNAVSAAPDPKPDPYVLTAISPDSSSINYIEVTEGEVLNLTALSERVNTTGDWYVASDTWTNATEGLGAIGIGPSYSSTATFDSASYAVGDKVVVTYTIVLQRGEGSGQSPNIDGTDSAYVEVIEETVTATIYIAPMAAPAVAAKILQFNNLKPSYRDGKLTGNFIADVAREMGPQTMFNEIEKGIWDDASEMEISNPAYREEVLDFLNVHPKMKNTLVMPTDEFFAAP